MVAQVLWEHQVACSNHVIPTKLNIIVLIHKHRGDGFIPEHIGEFNRMFQIVGVSDERRSDGHKLYKVQCMFCDAICLMALSDFKRRKYSDDPKRCNCGIHNPNKRIENRRLGRIFRLMKVRCYDEKNKSYKRYGGKGIRICKEWLKSPAAFEKWAMNNGYADDLSIDRIDSGKDYCPENCRWIPLVDNCRYKSTTIEIEVDGVVKTGRQWAEYLGIGLNMINKTRMKYGTEVTKKLIREMMVKKPNIDIVRKNNESWVAAYNIDT